MNSKLLKKTVAVTTSVATTISLSGISLFAPIFIANAATIVDGDIVKTATSFDVYIAKHVGTKKFKRLVLSPHVFASYGHLKWSNLKTVTQAEMDAYTTSDLVRAVSDPKVYRLSSALDADTGTRQWVNMTAAEFVSAGNDWDSIYEINAVDRDAYTVGTDVTPTGVTPAPVVPTGTGVSVSLASDSPAATSVAQGASNHAFTKINFVGGANTTVTSVVITRSGLAADADFSEIKLWDGATQLGGTQALNTVTHKATFTGLSWVVPAGTTKVLTVSGTIAAAGATVGNVPRLGIGAAADVVATTAVSGTFPAYGNAMTIAGVSVGNLNVTARTVPADSSPVAGATAVEIASWNLGAVTEGMSVRSIKVTQTGSASAIDVKNVMLKIDGVQIGSTVAALASDGTAVFNLSSSPYSINAGVTKIVYLYADISSGIVTGTTTRTIDFEITNATDVTVFGANSAGSVTITTGAQLAYTTQSGVAQTVGQGTIPTVAVNGATNPSAQNFVRGTTQQLFSALRFSNGVAQDVRIARLRLNLLGTDAGAVDISNVTLYKYDELTGTETQVGTATNFVGTVATYGADAPGLDTGIFDILKGKNFVLHVRADVATAGAWTSIEIALNEVRIDGIQSQANMDPIVVTSVDGLGEVRTHGAHLAVGTLTVGLSPSNPAAQNVVPGKLGHEYIRVDLRANGEDITLSTLVFSLEDNAAAAASGDFTNVKLWDGSTQIGSTVASPTSSATFSVNVTIKKDQTKTFTVTGDVPTNAATAWAGVTRVIGDFDTSSVFNSNLVATGVTSTASVTATSADVTGLGMTALAETITVAFQPLPSTTVVVSASGVVISRAVLAAGTAGNVNISSMTFSLDDVTGVNTTSAANTSLGSLGLYDGATLLKTATITDGTPDTIAFTGLNVTIPKGTQKVFDVKANALVAGTFFTGFLDLTAGGTATDVVGTGLLSNTTVYGTGTNAANSGGLTISAEGTLNVSVDAATPVASFVAVGTAGVSGVDFAKFRFAANTEAIDMEQLVVTLPIDDNTGSDNNDVANFSSIQLFDGSAAVSSKVFPTGNNDAAAVTYTFTFSPEFRVPKDSFKVLTLKGDLNGTASGANSTTTPKFHIADVAGDTDGTASSITARGASSAQRVTSSAVGTNPETAANVNAMTIVRSKPVFALCTASNCTKASPTGALLPGVTEVIRFRIAAEGDDVVFDSNSNVRFTIAQSGGAVTGRNAVLYEVGVTSALQTVSAIDLTSAGTINFNAITSTISSGTFKEYYATVDLTDYATTGETFRLSVEAADADVSWDDGVSADVTNTPSVTNLPITGGTLVK